MIHLDTIFGRFVASCLRIGVVSFVVYCAPLFDLMGNTNGGTSIIPCVCPFIHYAACVSSLTADDIKSIDGHRDSGQNLKDA